MMSAAATAMAGDELLRNLSREDVISRTIESLRRVAAQVTEDEVTAIVDGFEITSDTYEADAIHRAVEESLRLWASRDQVGLTCTLKLSQEHTIEEQNSMKEELGDLKSRLEVETVTTRLAQQVILEDQESLKEELRQLKSNMEEKLADSEAKMKAMAEEKPQATQSAEDLLKRLADLEEQITKVMPKETEASKQKDAKTGAAKELTEEEKKEKKREDDAWGDSKSYDEAFEELQKDKEKNDLALFSKLSEEIREKHGVWEEARSLMPAFYSNSLARLGSSVKLNYQPFFKDINELFEFHKEKKPLFDKQVKYVAHETKGKALIPGMKGQPRCKAKAAFKYTDATGTSWHRCTDIVRATILYHDIRSMYEGLKLLDKLHKEGKMEIVEFNDRYLTPMPGNYRDLQLSVKIDGMISELQLNTRIMAYVKEHAGHRSFEVSRELVAAVKESDSKRCDDILSWGKELLGDESVQEIVNGKEKPVLHEAARQGNADLVSVFLHYKADVNLKDNEGQSALHKAMAGGYERATWALICSGAKFDADQKGMTPLMEGLLKLRVNPANEAVARCVSTLAQTMVAQGCFKRELEGLSARLEVFVQERLKQSSDLIAACKDCDLQKLDRLLRDWADPNSRDIAGDGLHAVHVALHGGRMDFSAERAEVLRRLLEFRASPDATAKMPEGQESTALEVALKSSNRKAHIGLAVLIQHGARHRKKRVMDYLQWTAKDAQEAEPRAVVRQFLATWRYVVDLDQSLMLKACPLELLLFRGYEAAKRCKVDEDVKRQAALHVASILYSHGHFFELEALLGAECNLQDFRVFVVSGAGGDGTGCNGEYRQVREENGKRLYKMTGGDAIIYWDYGRWSMKSWENSEFTLYQSDRIQTETPPEGQWFAARHEVSPPPVVSSRKDQEHLLDHVQQLEYWVSLAVAAESSEGKHAVLHAAVSCQALQDTAEAASVQRAALTVAGMLRGQQQVEAAEELLQHYAVEDFALTKRFHFYGQIPVAWRGDFLATSREARRGTEVEIYNGAKDFIRLKTLDIPYGIVSVALCQDLLAIGAGREVKIYDSAQDFLLLKTLDEATDFIWSLSFAGQLLAAGSEDNSVRVYDRAQEFVLVKTLQEASGLIRSVAWSQHLLAAGGEDKIVRIYDALQDFTLVKSLEEASDEVMAVAWSGGLLAAGGLDTKIRIYDSSQDYVLVRTLDRAPKGILSLSCCGNFLATGSLDCRVRIYDTSQDFIIVKVLEMPGCVPELAFHGSYLAVGAKSGREMSIFDAENLRWGAFEVDRLWDFAKRPEQQEEQSPSKHSAVKDAD